jgi:hypothetical protein
MFGVLQEQAYRRGDYTPILCVPILLLSQKNNIFQPKAAILQINCRKT